MCDETIEIENIVEFIGELKRLKDDYKFQLENIQTPKFKIGDKLELSHLTPYQQYRMGEKVYLGVVTEIKFIQDFRDYKFKWFYCCDIAKTNSEYGRKGGGMGLFYDWIGLDWVSEENLKESE